MAELKAVTGAPMSMPEEVATAIALWRATIVLWFVHGVLAAIVFAQTQRERFVPDITRILTEANQGRVPSEHLVDVLFYVAGIGGTVVVELIIAAGLLGLTFLMRRAKNWARIVLEVFGIFQILQAGGLLFDQGQLEGVIGFTIGALAIIAGVLAGYAIVLGLRQPANHFFHQRPPLGG